MSMQVTWRGEEVKRKVHEAERRALEETAKEAVARAKSSHPGWKSVTGEAERSITATGVERTRGGFRVMVGSTLPRFVFLELGVRGRTGDHTIRRAGDVAAAGLPRRVRQAVAR